MQENHCHLMDEDCNPELVYQKTEAQELDTLYLDTKVPIETAAHNLEKDWDKPVPVNHEQALLLDYKLYV